MRKIIQKVWDYKNRKCVILWISKTHFCAYVETKLKGVSYNEEFECYITCHGGLTFSGELKEYIKDKKWYFGMDFAHAGDYVNYGHSSLISGHKWTLEEVKKETESLADEILKYEKIYPKLKKEYKRHQKETKEILK